MSLFFPHKEACSGEAPDMDLERTRHGQLKHHTFCLSGSGNARTRSQTCAVPQYAYLALPAVHLNVLSGTRHLSTLVAQRGKRQTPENGVGVPSRSSKRPHHGVDWPRADMTGPPVARLAQGTEVWPLGTAAEGAWAMG